MKAIIQEAYGSIDNLELREVDRPVIGDDEVLVRVRAASVHPDVWHVVMGRPYVLRLMGAGFRKPKNPIPGTDMAGIVESTGKNVTRFRPGDAVFGETVSSHQWTHGGTYAEYVSVPEDRLELKPDNVTFEQAAAVPTSGYIALMNLRMDSLVGPDKKVLVNGAGGGVGSIALQTAKAYGSHVTGVDTTDKLDLLRKLGADRIVDYTRENFTRSGERYDLIFDVPGNYSFSDCRKALKPDGKYILIGHAGFSVSKNRFFGLLPRFFKLIFRSFFIKQLRLGTASIPDRKETMACLSELLEAGKISPVIDSIYPLSETRESLRHMVEGKLWGKVIVTLEESSHR